MTDIERARTRVVTVEQLKAGVIVRVGDLCVRQPYVVVGIGPHGTYVVQDPVEFKDLERG